MRACLPLLAAGLLAATAPAQAHHSLAGYDAAQPRELRGVVAEFAFVQPHPYMTIVVEAAGPKQTWRLEMDNLYELREIGLTRDSFKPGERVLVRGDPQRDGSPRMYLRRLDRPSDGLLYQQVGTSPTVSLRGKPLS